MSSARQVVKQNMQKKRVMVILPRGEAIRNFFYTGVCKKVREEAEVLVLSVRPCERVWQLMRDECDALEELHNFREPYALRVLREIMNFSHAVRLRSEASRHRIERRMAEASDGRRIYKIWAKILAGTALSPKLCQRALESAEEHWAARTANAVNCDEVLLRWKPDLIFNASHVHGVQVRPLLARARAHGIPLQTFVFSWDNLTTQGKVIPKYDSYLVWSDTMAEELLAIYPETGQRRVKVTGSPQFDMHFNRDNWMPREQFCQLLQLDHRRPIVLYTTGMPNHMPFEEEIVELVYHSLQEFEEEKRPQMLVRVYAKDLSGRFERLFERYPEIRRAPCCWESNYFTPLPEDEKWYYNELAHCDAGINVASTVSLELLMHQKPVLNIAFDPPGRNIRPCSYERFYRYDHYVPVVESGAVRIVKNPLELKTAIRQAVEEKVTPRRATAGQKLLARVFGKTLDGKSACRVAEGILEQAYNSALRAERRGPRAWTA